MSWRDRFAANVVGAFPTTAYVIATRLSDGMEATVVEPVINRKTKRFKVPTSKYILERQLFRDQLAKPVRLDTRRVNAMYPNASHPGHWIYADIIFVPGWVKPDSRPVDGYLHDLSLRIVQAEIEATASGAIPPFGERECVRISTAPRRKAVPRDVQAAVFHRDGGLCVACGSDENLQFDHIIPWSKGGSDGADNLQVLCRGCNASKSAGF